MRTAAIILARAGSKGVPGKNMRPIAGRPCAAWTIQHALEARRTGSVRLVAVSTDSPELRELAEETGVTTIDRPPDLATDTATVDAAARHALVELERHAGGRIDAAVILYANVPVRPGGGELIARAVSMLATTGADSVQSYCPVGKHHPWWTARVEPEAMGGRVGPWEGDVLNHGIYRRQDLPPALIPDGAVLAVTRRALMLEIPGVAAGPHAFFGLDRRGIINPEGSVVDIDAPSDLLTAEAALAPGRGGGEMTIRERRIGPGHGPYIIAEIGVNHDGAPERALELVRAAADAGADAVKFQYFRAEMLMSRGARLAAYQSAAGETDPCAMLKRLELNAGDLERCAALAHKLGVHAIVSVFSIALVAEMDRLPWDAFKAASPDIVNRPLLEAMFNAAGRRPLIVSTGAATAPEVSLGLSWLGAHIAENAARLGVLQCVSSYPCAEGDAALGAIGVLRELTGLATGYSDHTPGEDTGALAVAAGACILEKHLTHDRSARGPDHGASLDPAQFARYAVSARRANAMLGPREKRLLESELEVRRVSRQSLVAARAIRAGEVIAPGDVTTKRPGTGVPARKLGLVIGRAASRDIPADAPLAPEDLA